jgi:hypothetical protein
VPQQEAWIVERFGRFHRILQPGLNVLFPFIDQVRYVQSLKEIVLAIPSQSAVTHGTPVAKRRTHKGERRRPCVSKGKVRGGKRETERETVQVRLVC